MEKWANQSGSPIQLSEYKRTQLGLFSVDSKDAEKVQTVIVPADAGAPMFARMSYADGKLYYMSAHDGFRAQLRATDVTLQVNCKALMPMLKPSFRAIQTSQMANGKVFTALPHFVGLHEGSMYARRFPWHFMAYKKLQHVRNATMVKLVVCSKPKQPNTRPSGESCCVDKYTEASRAIGDKSSNRHTCNIADVLTMY